MHRPDDCQHSRLRWMDDSFLIWEIEYAAAVVAAAAACLALVGLWLSCPCQFLLPNNTSGPVQSGSWLQSIDAQ